MNHVPWLTLCMLASTGFAALLLLVPRNAAGTIKAITVAGTLATAAITAGLLIAFTHNPAPGPLLATASGGRTAPITFQFEEFQTWIPGIGAGYHLGLDGVSAWLLGLDAALFLLAALITSRSTERLRFFCALLLITQTATIGVLLSLDLLLFYFFWEAMLVPLYFILSGWGDVELRQRATLKFIIYTVSGSFLMLLSIIYIYFQSPPVAGGSHASFDLVSLVLNPGPTQDPVSFTIPVVNIFVKLLTPLQFAFLGFAIAFAIKVPIVPFHTWLPDAYVSCTPAALVFFAGIVGKMGAFGFIRYALTLFPGPVQDFHLWIAALAVVSIVYGALNALAATDIKLMVAYASLSHLGFIVLGIFSLDQNGLNGAVIQMINHGVIIATLFIIVAIVENRTGTRDRRKISGLEARMPWLYGFFLISTLAGLSMPGTNGFVGEFTILLGAWQASYILVIFAGIGVVLAAWYMLRLHQGLMHDPPSPAAEKVRDIGIGERLVLLPLVGIMLALGVYPRPVGEVARANVAQYVTAATTSTSPAQAAVSP